MLQTAKSQISLATRQGGTHRASRNPAPIVVPEIDPHPATTPASPRLAQLVSIATERKLAFQSLHSADEGTGDRSQARHAESAADAAQMAAIQCVVHEPANSIQDVLVKFSIVRDTAELEDIVHQMERPGSTQTERMLWSICADLLELGRHQSLSFPGGSPLESLPPDVLARRLETATVEFVRRRGDAGSSAKDFDAAAESMDAAYNALIGQNADRSSVVALQLAAVASQARLHAKKDGEPELDEVIDFKDFERLVSNLSACSQVE